MNDGRGVMTVTCAYIQFLLDGLEGVSERLRPRRRRLAITTPAKTVMTLPQTEWGVRDIRQHGVEDGQDVSLCWSETTHELFTCVINGAPGGSDRVVEVWATVPTFGEAVELVESAEVPMSGGQVQLDVVRAHIRARAY